MSEIGDKIIEILSEKDKLKMEEIKIKLNELGSNPNYETLGRTLTIMMKDKRIFRGEEGDPWYYFYTLKKEHLEK
jgi:hypothetical protein